MKEVADHINKAVQQTENIRKLMNASRKGAGFRVREMREEREDDYGKREERTERRAERIEDRRRETREGDTQT